MVRTFLALLGLLVAIVLGAPAPASGAEVEGSITAGSQWWRQSNQEAKFQEFSDEPRGAILRHYELRAWRDKNLALFYGNRAFQHDQAHALTFWHGAKLRIDASYREIPHNLSFIARSPFTEIAPGVERVPDSLQAQNQANPAGYVARIRDALAVSPRLNLGFRTDISKARLRARPVRGWQFELTGARRNRSGRKPYGGGWSPGNGVEIWEPIAQRIVEGEARASYSRDRATLMATAGLSQFNNHVDALIFDNPARLTGAQSQGRIDLYPDNRSIRGTVGLAYRLPVQSALNAAVGLSRDTQKDPWLPYTITPTDPYSSVDSLPPERNTQAKANILTQDYRLTSRPRTDVTTTLSFRQYHYLNRTPVHVFSGESVADGTFSPGALESDVHSYKHQLSAAEVTYNPVRQISLTGAADLLRRSRTHREVLKDREEGIGGKLRLRPTDKVALEGRYRRANRWSEEKDTDFSYEGLDQPALRRFDVADRKQVSTGGGFTFSPTARVDLGGSFNYLFEKYSDDLAESTRIGLRRIHARSASGDLTYHASETVELQATVGWEQSMSYQASRQSRTAAFGTADSTWTARIKDEGLFGAFDLDWRAMSRLGFHGTFDYSRFPTTFVFFAVAPTITAQVPPAVRYKRIDVILDGTYNLAKDTQVGLEYAYQEWDAIDFAAVNIPLLGIAAGASNVNYIYLGDSFQSYRAHRVALLVRQSF